MAKLQKYFPGNIYPDVYNPPINGLDYMPTFGELIDFGNASRASRTSTQSLYKFDNGIQLKIGGTGFTYDSNGDFTGGKVTSLQVLTKTGALIDSVTTINIDANDFQMAAEGYDAWEFQEWLLKTNDTIIGGNGNDDIYGFGGNDVLKGGAGDDFIVGGEGKDSYDGGAGWDQLSFDDAYYATNALRGVTIDATARTVIDPYGNKESFTGIEAFRGTQFKDVMKGSSANENFMGLGGADAIDGGGGFDNVQYHRDVRRGGDAGVTIDLAKGYAVDGFGKKDTLKNIEGARGTEFGDKLFGSTGDNYFRADGGTDYLYGKAGNDELVGGAGKDRFYFDTALNASKNVDLVRDFNVADDTFYLENAIFTKIAGVGQMSNAQFYASTNGKAHDANDRVIYNKTTGDLFYDSDGNGATAAVRFADLSANLPLTSTDFFIY